MINNNYRKILNVMKNVSMKILKNNQNYNKTFHTQQILEYPKFTANEEEESSVKNSSEFIIIKLIFSFFLFIIVKIV